MVVMYSVDKSAPAKAQAEGVLTGSLNLQHENGNFYEWKAGPLQIEMAQIYWCSRLAACSEELRKHDTGPGQAFLQCSDIPVLPGPELPRGWNLASDSTI